MKRLILSTMFLTMLVVCTNGTEPFSGRNSKFGIKMLSVQSLNDALHQEGLAKLNSNALLLYIGKTAGRNNWFIDTGFTAYWVRGKEDQSTSSFSCFGIPFGYGYKIWENNSMCVYSYLNLSWMPTRLQIDDKTSANSFSSAFASPATTRAFFNQEIDSALGLSIHLGKKKREWVEISGRYNFRLWQSKWNYSGNTIKDFPRVDCRGWEIGIAWGVLDKKCNKKAE